MTHTEGPWRWEYNAEYRSVHLVGGRPTYDLTVMDFTRWGMTGAGIRLRELSERGMNLMHKLHERPDWIAPFPGRAHHKHWCAAVIHPDMCLIESAPDLLEALESCVIWNGKRGPDDNLLPIDRQPGEIAKAMRAIAMAKGEQL